MNPPEGQSSSTLISYHLHGGPSGRGSVAGYVYSESSYREHVVNYEQIVTTPFVQSALSCLGLLETDAARL